MEIVFVIAYGLMVQNPLSIPLLIGALILGSVVMQSLVVTLILVGIALSLAALASGGRNLDLVPLQFLLVGPIALLLHIPLRRIRPR